MATENRVDIAFNKGASATFLVTITDESGARVDLTGARLKYTVKADVTLPLEAIVKDSAVGITEIDILDQTAGATTVGQANVFIVPSDTLALASAEYFYDVWVELATGARHPVVTPSSFFLQTTITTF